LIIARSPIGKAREKYETAISERYQRIYFSEENLHIQDSETLLRSPWAKSIGYLENDSLVLLYYPGGFYRPIPKRALTGRGAEFGAQVRAKLPSYDYRKRRIPPTGNQ
jgi:hypothetical protein